MKKILLFCIFILLVLGVSTVFVKSSEAQDAPPSDGEVLSEGFVDLEGLREDIDNGVIDIDDVPLPMLELLQADSVGLNSPEIASCFDYYTFNSIDVQLNKSSDVVSSGTQMTFTGNVINNNSYPVVEGTLYVKVFKALGEEKDPSGPDVIDQFVAVKDINLPANGSKPVEFTWDVPTYAVSGDYTLATYFLSDDSYNLLGLSFTNDIVGNTYNFEIVGEQEGELSFIKDSVYINDTQYFFATFPPIIEENKDATIEVQVQSSLEEAVDATITWKLYKWDSVLEKNLVVEFYDFITLEAGDTTDITVTLPDQEDPVYLLVGELVYQDTKSIVNIRYIREGVDKARINYAGVTNYPLQKGGTMFACVHNSGQSNFIENNKVVLEVIDMKGNVVDSYTYEGAITGDMMAVKKELNIRKLKDFDIKTSLYTNDSLIEESLLEYRCNAIDPDNCSEITWGAVIVGILILLLVLAIIFYSKNHLKKKDLIVSLAFVFFAASMFVPSTSEAARSTVWNGNVDGYLYYYWSNDNDVTSPLCLRADCNSKTGGWGPGLGNPTISIEYQAEVRNADTGGEVSNNASVPIGTRLEFIFKKHQNNQISWNGTGYSQGSPYGEWAASSKNAPPIDTCRQSDLVRTGYKYIYRSKSPSGVARGVVNEVARWFDIYVPFVVGEPGKWFTGNSGLSNCTDLTKKSNGDFSRICTVTGNVSTVFNFGQTDGRFYYRYLTRSNNRCISNNIPMRYRSSFDISREGYIWGGNVAGSDYVVNIPKKEISYTINAFQPNRSPNTPTLSCPATGYRNENTSFTFTGTDPDNDKIKYGVSWDGNNTVNEWIPANSYVNSGTSRTATKSWSGTGVKTIKVRTMDQTGVKSDWATCSVNIQNRPVINGKCGTAVTTCSAGTLNHSPTDTSTQYLWSCDGLYGGARASCSLNKPTYTRTLSFNANGGNGVTRSVSCNAAGPNSSCDVVVPQSDFWRTGYTFGGWSYSGWKNPDYAVGNSISISRNYTLDANWNKIIPLPTNLNATCSPDGKSITSTWRRASGYDSIYFRISPRSNIKDSTLWHNDLRADSRTTSITPGIEYRVWIHTKDGEAYSPAVEKFITCQTPINQTPINGICGTSNATCSAGTLNHHPADTSTQYLWSCDGLYGGARASCSLNKPTYTRTLSFNKGAADATGTMNPVSCNATTSNGSCSVPVPSNTFVRLGYRFTNWTLTPGNVPGYQSGQEFSMGTNYTMTANWQIIPPPTNPSLSCSADGRSATLSWERASGYSGIYFRAAPLSSPADQTLWWNNLQADSRTISITPGVDYIWWIHTYGPNGTYSNPLTTSGRFRCGNNPPTNPAISGPTTGTVNTSYTFNMRSTDPDEDVIGYQIDWQDGSSMDWRPVNATFRAPSGQSVSINKSWSTTGTKTFRVRAKDKLDGDSASRWSGWTSHTIVVAETSSLSCTAGIYQVGESAQYTATNIPGASYQWYIGSDIIEGATSRIYSRTFSSEGSYTRTVRATVAGETQSASCTATITDDGNPPCTGNDCGPGGGGGGEPGGGDPDGGGGGSDAQLNNFRFNPNIESTGGLCPLEVEVINTTGCTITNRFGAVQSIGALTDTTFTVSGATRPVGTYSLTCIGTNGAEAKFGSRACYSNPDIIEN